MSDIAIDLDGTLAQDSGDFPEIGMMIDGADIAMGRLKDMGYRVWVYSCRTNGYSREEGTTEDQYNRIQNWLEENGIPYDEIVLPEDGKIFADFYVDDKALPFRGNWDEVLDQVEERTIVAKDVVALLPEEKMQERYADKMAKVFSKAVSSNSKARKIYEKTKDTIPGSNRGKVLSRRRRAWMAVAKKDKYLLKIAEEIGGDARVYQSLRLMLEVVSGQKKLKDVKKSVRNYAKMFFKEKMRSESKAEVFDESGYTEELMSFLPEQITFELGPTREIKKVIEVFGREKRNWAMMMKRLAYIVKSFNKIVSTVKKDMKSNDEETALCALMTAIIIETGLRPSALGNQANVKDPKTGKKIAVDTFGVTTLKGEHVKFVRKNFAELSFRGKKGVWNFATLSDGEILKMLKRLMKRTDMAGSNGMIFVTKSGNLVTDADLRKYISSRWSDISPTDFRKLKSTQVFYDNIKEQIDDMQLALLEAVNSGKKDLKAEVVRQVTEVLQNAFERSQKALSHDSISNTINFYTDPRVIINFLNQGGLDDTLEDILMKNKNVELTFDVDSFIRNVKKKASNGIEVNERDLPGESAEDVLEDLEKFDMILSSDLELRVASWYIKELSK